jgi:hypothetical protein
MKQKSEVAEAADFYFAVPSGKFPLFKLQKPQRFCNILQEKVGRVHGTKYYTINIRYGVKRRKGEGGPRY